MKLTGLWRHPIKGIGREPLDSVRLEAGRALPGDRAFAIAHAGCPDQSGSWRPRGDFLVAASGPELAAVSARSDGDTITLRHPDRPEASFTLPQDGARLIDWVRPLWPEARPAPQACLRAPAKTGMSDNGMASVSILTEASLDALSKACGQPVEHGRFRGNLILDGGAPWAEFDWVGRKLHIGDAVLEIIEPIERCRATEANTETGVRDINMLSVLRDSFGHRHFGVYARAVDAGTIALGDSAELSGEAAPAAAPVL